MLQIMASFIDSNPMEKDRELRYQHTSEMKTDLMRVKRDSRFGRVEQAECRRGSVILGLTRNTREKRFRAPWVPLSAVVT